MYKQKIITLIGAAAIGISSALAQPQYATAQMNPYASEECTTREGNLEGILSEPFTYVSKRETVYGSSKNPKSVYIRSLGIEHCGTTWKLKKGIAKRGGYWVMSSDTADFFIRATSENNDLVSKLFEDYSQGQQVNPEYLERLAETAKLYYRPIANQKR